MHDVLYLADLPGRYTEHLCQLFTDATEFFSDAVLFLLKDLVQNLVAFEQFRIRDLPGRYV